MSIAKTVVLITGANSGIGYQTVRHLLASERPYHIFLGARSNDKSQSAITRLVEEYPRTSSELSPLVIDLESDDSIAQAHETIKAKTDVLDVLINNAGVELDGDGAENGLKTRQIFDKTWSTNVTGPYILTSTLIPLLLKSKDGRILFLTSGTASFELSTNEEFFLNISPEAGWPKKYQRELPSYKSSKVGLNMIMRDFYRILKNDNIKVWTVNPGFVVTGLGGNPETLKNLGAGNPDQSGSFVKDVVEGKRDKDVGKTVQQKWLYGDVLPF
ncbi:uncharacterized protein L201_003949 [Kwoniella dendrophila CBS 6074]|uniref:Short-chain dehydrogenase n=1 Tax=Kwoniella dendrophila CBS 6074 TaxID=1295534 RepID=A0AAX4JUZ3_9TREE